MGLIKKLDANIANKIAAGEVIEKLGNVVKELVENAIDAEATKIDIDLLDSGMKSIKVTDNGTGMDEDDALLAFERHATSKITNVNDLFRIQSLGFRGEALPSIASISRVELCSSIGEEGVEIIFEDGKMISKNKISMNQGTRIEVTKLFYSTPARFKYLKSSQYELAVIVSLVNGFALANPHISFRLTNDKKQLFVSHSNDSVTNLMAQIYGLQVGKSLIYFEKENRDYHVYGYTTNPIV
ncbi:MAG: DNA mismatch repair endonuclease MutL, partial [Candidatus Izemoplasmatales bacterium]|nr:DNA mismatch repair endonuclease MutL [Candidatus Izemoplasmatales bacterium]